MATYQNGQIPASLLVLCDSSTSKYLHRTTRTSRARWYALRAKVKREKGVTLYITPGVNAYRDLGDQRDARQWACSVGNCLGAAQEGTSSHGGDWAGPITGWKRVDAMAFDIANYWMVPWDYFKAACASVGLTADAIPLSMSGGVSERHHIIDFDPHGPIPASLDVEDFTTEEEDQEVDDMLFVRSETTKRWYVIGELTVTRIEKEDHARAAAYKAARDGRGSALIKGSYAQSLIADAEARGAKFAKIVSDSNGVAQRVEALAAEVAEWREEESAEPAPASPEEISAIVHDAIEQAQLGGLTEAQLAQAVQNGLAGTTFVIQGA